MNRRFPLPPKDPRLQRLAQILSDRHQRQGLLLQLSLAGNLGFAIFKLLYGFAISSTWITAMGIYYGILAILRNSLLSGHKEAPQSPRDWRTYGRAGLYLLILTLPMAALMVQVVLHGESYQYPGILIYAFALFAFLKVGSALRGVIVAHHGEHMGAIAARQVTMVCALMSILSLQTALNSRYDTDGSFSFISNALYCFFVIVTVTLISVTMLVKAHRALHS